MKTARKKKKENTKVRKSLMKLILEILMKSHFAAFLWYLYSFIFEPNSCKTIGPPKRRSPIWRRHLAPGLQAAQHPAGQSTTTWTTRCREARGFWPQQGARGGWMLMG